MLVSQYSTLFHSGFSENYPKPGHFQQSYNASLTLFSRFLEASGKSEASPIEILMDSLLVNCIPQMGCCNQLWINYWALPDP